MVLVEKRKGEQRSERGGESRGRERGQRTEREGEREGGAVSATCVADLSPMALLCGSTPEPLLQMLMFSLCVFLQ